MFRIEEEPVAGVLSLISGLVCEMNREIHILLLFLISCGVRSLRGRQGGLSEDNLVEWVYVFNACKLEALPVRGGEE